MKISVKIVCSIIGLYVLVSIPSVVLSIYTHIYNMVFILTTNTPSSFYGDLLTGIWWWIAILIAGLGVYLIKISRRYLVKVS